MPDKRQLVTSKVFFGSEIAGLLDHSYNKYALTYVRNMTHISFVSIFYTLSKRPTNFRHFFYFCQFSNENLKTCQEKFS